MKKQESQRVEVSPSFQIGSHRVLTWEFTTFRFDYQEPMGDLEQFTYDYQRKMRSAAQWKKLKARLRRKKHGWR